ncbi:DUF4190 domain-containing protein [Nonomuraea insulae]|uniref:DUF4190 domain-containing protein n=1 Tax=Nonomuraea insulae TaxID=1616787 RepID=A0ABW1DF86_9ACTN
MTTPGDPNEPRTGQDPHEGRPDEGEQPPTPPRHEPEWWNEGALEDDQRPPEIRPYESGPTSGDETPEEWSAGGPPGAGPTGGAAPEERAPEPERPDEGEEPIEPVPPVVPPPDAPPTHEPWPAGQPTHPDLPTSPETPAPTGADAEKTSAPTGADAEKTTAPTGADAEETQAYQIPGARPTYPGWGGASQAPHEEEPPARPTPSRYDQGDQPYFSPAEGSAPPPGSQAGAPPQGATGYERDQESNVPGTTPSSPYGGPPGYPPPAPPGSPYGQYGPQYGDYGPYQQPRPGSGLATASLVLGVASPFLVFVCFTGLITAILSIVFGCVALAKRVGKGRAVAGIVISALSLVLFAIVAIWFWNVVQECAHLPGQLADRCFQDRFPWMSGAR